MMSLNHTARITLDGDFSTLALTKAYKKKTLTKNKENALAFFFFFSRSGPSLPTSRGPSPHCWVGFGKCRMGTS